MGHPGHLGHRCRVSPPVRTSQSVARAWHQCHAATVSWDFPARALGVLGCPTSDAQFRADVEHRGCGCVRGSANWRMLVGTTRQIRQLRRHHRPLARNGARCTLHVLTEWGIQMTDEPNIKSNERLDPALRIIGVLLLVPFVAALLVLMFTDWIRQDVRSVVIAHSGAIVVMPAAGVFALLIVAIFQVTSGNVEFEALGFKLKGAAGPILMWIVAYAVIAITIWLNW
jgi:hypothetical protein